MLRRPQPTETRLGRGSSVVYDLLGRAVQQTAADPDGLGPDSAPVTTFVYDIQGNLLTQTDPLNHSTINTYDNLGRKLTTTDANADTTTYTYDPAGRMTSLTDASGNTTSWTFGATGQVIEETITVDSAPLSRSFSYDAAGNLVEKTDRNGRVTKYTYDNLLRQTTEAWYADVNDLTADFSYTTSYDSASRVASVSDGTTSLSYDYSIFGNLTSQTQSLSGLADDVVFDYTYDAAARKTSVATKIGTTDDYVNEYDYDALDRIVKVTQAGIPGGNAVAEKRVDFAYNDDGTSATITRYADLAATKMVAVTDQAFDHLGRVSDITHRRADEVFANYDYTWDKSGRITAIDMDFSAGTTGTEHDDTATYTYDNTSQLTDADYVSQTDEDYSYDETGNRTMTGYTTGDQNRMTTDAAGYTYLYDREGNRTAQFVDTDSSGTLNTGDTDITQYTWDHRNRLVEVTQSITCGTTTQIVTYSYDAMNQMVERTVDSNADETVDARRVFVHEGGQIVLHFEATGSGELSGGDLAHRYLWSPSSVDALIADEAYDGTQAAEDVLWALCDHLNTVRDLVRFATSTETVSLANHITFDSFGNLVSETSTYDTDDSLFHYTGKIYDTLISLQWNLNRWYDPSTGRWISEDPISFKAGDVNLYAYVGNGVLFSIDPTGLKGPGNGPGGSYRKPPGWVDPDAPPKPPRVFPGQGGHTPPTPGPTDPPPVVTPPPPVVTPPPVAPPSDSAPPTSPGDSCKPEYIAEVDGKSWVEHGSKWVHSTSGVIGSFGGPVGPANSYLFKWHTSITIMRPSGGDKSSVTILAEADARLENHHTYYRGLGVTPTTSVGTVAASRASVSVSVTCGMYGLTYDHGDADDDPQRFSFGWRGYDLGAGAAINVADRDSSAGWIKYDAAANTSYMGTVTATYSP